MVKILVENDLEILRLIQETEGISSYELSKKSGLHCNRIDKITRKLWNRRLIGGLYNTWSANKDDEEATEGEWKK